MKNCFAFIFFSLLVLSGHAAIEPQNRSTNLKYDGTIDSASLEKEYINVINRAGSTVAVGTAMVLDLTEDDGASVTTSSSDGQVPICIMAVSCADDALCKCQTYGLNADALVNVASGAAVAGKPFYLSTLTAGYIGNETSPAAGDIPGGVFYDAASSSGAVQVFIKMK
jgi:hypothetical protein